MNFGVDKNRPNRVLIMAHGHPDFSLGGGELAAYNLFKALRDDGTDEHVWFIARHESENGPTGAVTLRRKNEYLWQQSLGNSFMLKAANSHAIWNDFRQMIRALKPTVVNLHHYLHLGIELLRVIKMEDPSIKVVLTLHEYMAICHQQGQMVKRGTNKLCFYSSIADCNRCFPEFSKEQFWLRRNFIGQHFDYVDHFVSPSHFLKQRYVEWGISEGKISVIENGQSPEPKLLPRNLAEGETRNRIAFFGQINPFKGIDLLLAALLSMKKKERNAIRIEIHGANFEHQADSFKSSINSMADKLIKEGVLRWAGPYEPSRIAERMRNVDWVIVPSIWWENSPMVIQEAFVYGRPVIAANIGGMLEKVKDGIDGIHFEAGNKADLSFVLKRAAEFKNDEWLKLYEGIAPPLDYLKCAELYKILF